MLAAEQARERLQAQRLEDWEKRREKRLRGVSPAATRAAATLAAAHAWSVNPSEDSGLAVERLADRERQALFEALFPALGVHLDRMWENGKLRHYQHGWGRRAFRAPSQPSLTLPVRAAQLVSVTRMLEGYEPDAVWVARWSPYIGYADYAFAPLLAAAIDGRGDEGEAVFETLVASAEGEDEIGAMGRHVSGALLIAGREDGWDYVERLLIAAQRQEGLRQAILEAVDEAHPQAFRRFVAVILENDLARFSATARAIDVWFSLGVGAGDVRTINSLLERVLRYLDDADARAEALRSGSGEDAYFALWTLAFEDAPAAIPRARALLVERSPERRFAAVHLLADLGLDLAVEALAPALEDDDLRVAARALDGTLQWQFGDDGPDVFPALERLCTRLERPQTKLEPILWPWTERVLDRRSVGTALVRNLRKRDPAKVIPYLDAMEPFARAQVARLLAERGGSRGAGRRALLRLVGDASPDVRKAALGAVEKIDVADAEAEELEALLTRKAGDLRRAVTGLLVARGEAKALASADRLLASSDRQQRLGGLEILRRLVEDGRAVAEARRRGADYERERDDLEDVERTQLEAIKGEEEERPSLENALGLLDTSSLTKPRTPRRHDVQLVSEAGIAVLRELDELVHQDRDERVRFQTWGREEEVLLGDAGWRFPRRSRLAGWREDGAERETELPLREVWEEWRATRGAATKDEDGFELLRALVTPAKAQAPHFPGFDREQPGERAILGRHDVPTLRYPLVVGAVVEWLALDHLPPDAPEFLLDASETQLALVPRGDLIDKEPEQPWGARLTWRDAGWLGYLEVAREARRVRPNLWTVDQHARLWQLERWVEAPLDPSEGLGLMDRLRRLRHGAAIRRIRPPLAELLTAFREGAASDADVIAHLLGPRGERYDNFHALAAVSGRKPHALARSAPRVLELVDRCRRRIIDVELERGEAPTAASAPALALRYSGGLDVLVRLLKAIGKERFVRGWSYDSESRAVVFSRLIRASFPADHETPQTFVERVRSERIADKRLIELAAFAPQWTRHVEATVGWPELASAIWWMHAHTKDTSWTVEQEIREAWAAEVAERTPLAAVDLIDGAVDVEWFRKVYAALGEERWKAVDAAAKYCSTGGGHKRAQLFADAMRGIVDEAELRKRIEEKRHQDSVRALGLLPLPGGAGREDAVLARYAGVQEFVRTSRQFGSQRQASERRAAEIGLDNLARTAGYKDPIRLGWAMEARGIGDLAEGPLSVVVGDVEVSLALDDRGEPHLQVRRGERTLKSVPAEARKSPEVKQLRKRSTDLRRQGSRIRHSLEAAMVRGDTFSGAELHELAAHLVLAPKLSDLILVGEGIAGYPVAEGRALLDHSARQHAVGPSEVMRIAHPVDLLDGGEWSEWQRDCLAREVVQPFKQVFRELYVPTNDELRESVASRRYAGHQLQPRKAFALLGGRGWVAHPDEGIRKTFHDAGLAASLWFLNGALTPVEVEAPTLEEVRFHPLDSWEPFAVADVPPRVFSEVMRDLDLVVSVAHAGGVDPEATASTIEMRAALVGETCRLLDIENARVDEPWVLVDGKLGEYSIHLGSAVVHRRPGGSVCIVPVHGQHRGRIFLPFADDDPKTAEVLSKVLLLARDEEIKDPTILEQLR